MGHRSSCFGLCAAGLLLVLGACGGKDPSGGGSSQVLQDKLKSFEPVYVPGERSGEEIYKQTCGYCHDHKIAPVILGRNLPPETLKSIARNGLNAMPAFRLTDISDSELDAVAKWISTSPVPAQGGK